MKARESYVPHTVILKPSILQQKYFLYIIKIIKKNQAFLLKKFFSENFLKSVTIPWFNSESRSIPDELHNTEEHECKIRNIFNAEHNFPTENSCYKNEQIYVEWKNSNFAGSCGVQAIPPNDNRLDETAAKNNKLIHGTDSTKG